MEATPDSAPQGSRSLKLKRCIPVHPLVNVLNVCSDREIRPIAKTVSSRASPLAKVSNEMTEHAIFITKVRTPAGKAAARLLIESIQTFGGEMSGCPVWVFATDPQNEPCRDLASQQVQVLPLSVPEAVKDYPFSHRVLACARAEALAPAGVQSLVWLDLNCLVVQPPVLFDLGAEFDAALRPVHIRNVGLPPSEPLDVFWKGIYAAIGVEDVHSTVDSFIDSQCLRSYFNSHGLAVKPARGLFHRWYEHFEHIASDEEFQAAACQDECHQVFLFQAIFSALAASSLDAQQIRILPPTYNYPYNLQDQVPEDRRAVTLNDLVCFTFEGRTIHPNGVRDIQIREPLRSWLEARVAEWPEARVAG